MQVLEGLLLRGLLVCADGVAHHFVEVGRHVDGGVCSPEIGLGTHWVAVLVFLKAFLQLRFDGLGNVGPGRVIDAGGVVALDGGSSGSGCRRHGERGLRNDGGGEEGRGDHHKQKNDGRKCTSQDRGRLQTTGAARLRAHARNSNARITFPNRVHFSGLRAGATNHAEFLSLQVLEWSKKQL